MRILLRGPGFLGDTLLCFPALELLRGAHPKAEWDVICPPHAAELWRRRGDVHAIHAAPQGRGEKRRYLGLARSLRRRGFDLAILFKSTLRDALVARLAGARRIAGFRREANQLMLDVALRSDPGRHYANSYAYLVDAALEITSRTLPATHLAANPTRHSAHPGRHVGLALGGPHKGTKACPPALAAQLASGLAARGDQLVFLGDADDVEAARQARAGLSPDVYTDLSGKTDVGALIDAIAGLDALVCIDSAPMHIAAATGVPVLILVGRSPSAFDRVVPRSGALRVLRPRPDVLRDEDLIASIDAEEVIAASLELAPARAPRPASPGRGLSRA